MFEVVDSLLGKVPAPKDFDPANLLGQSGLVKVSHKTRIDGTITAQVDSIVGLPDGMPVPAPEQALLFYSWDSPDSFVYGQLPEWLP